MIVADFAALGVQVVAHGFHPEATARTEAGETAIRITVGCASAHARAIAVGDGTARW